MMNYPVPKIGGENLSLHGLENYKANTRAYFISSIFDILVKFEKFSLVVYFKSQGVDGVSFVLSGVVIRLEQIV